MKRLNGLRKSTPIAALSVATIALLALSSCQDFFGTADLKDSIRDEVVVATAENVPLTVRPDPAVPGGTTSLSTTTQKVGVPFDISATVLAEYAFTGWSEPSGTGTVTFAAESELSTTATITEAVDGIIIQANFTRRPELELSDPFNYALDVFRNKTILLYFSKSMNPATVSFDTISITHKPYGSADPPTSITDLYQDPVAATGNLLFRLELKPGEALSELHLVTLRISRNATDSEGNAMAADAVISFRVSNEEDTIPPAWELTNPFTVQRADGLPFGTGNATNTASLILRPRGYDNDIVVGLEITEDDSIAPTVTDPPLLYGTAVAYSLQTTGEGSKVLTARLFDATGLESAATQQVSVIYDTQPPASPAVASSDAPYENGGTYFYATGGVDFTFTSSDITSGVAGFTTDAGGSNPLAVVNLTISGTVYAVDNARNVSSTGVALSIDQDNTDPSITGNTVTAPGDIWAVLGDAFAISFNVSDSGGSELNGTPTVSVTSGGDAVTGSVAVNGTGPGYTASVTLAAADTNGVIRYTINAADNVGNTTTLGPVDSGKQYDSIDPSVPSVATHNADYYGGGTYYYDGGSVTFTFDSTDTGSGVAGFTTDAGGSNPQSSIELTSTATVYAVDTAGNVSSGVVVSVVEDTSNPAAPTVATDDAPYENGGTYYYGSGGVTFTFNSSDTGSGLAGFTTDSGGSNPQSSLILTSSDTVYAVDNVGNVSGGSPLSLDQDNIDPSITGNTVTSPTGPWAVGGTMFSVSFTATDSGGSELDGTPSVNVTSGGDAVSGTVTVGGGGPGYTASVVLAAGDTNGVIRYTISAGDNVGNTATTGSVNSGVELDTVAPTQPAVATDNADFYGGGTYFYDSGGVDLTFNSSESGSGLVGFTTDSGGSNPQSLINLTSTSSVYAVDTAGNVSAGLAVNVEQDTSAPGIPSVSTDNADHFDGSTYYYDTGGVDFTFSSTEAGSGVAGYTTDSGGSNPQSSINLTTANTVYAVDNMGNVSSGLAISVEQDDTGPTISNDTVTSPAGAIANAGDTFSISFEVTDGGSGVNGLPSVGVTADGDAVTNGVVVSGSGPAYTASVLLDALDTVGDIYYTISAVDNAGNPSSEGPVDSSVALE